MLNVNFHPFPILRTERLVLRQMTEADDEALYRLRSNPEVMQYIDRPLMATTEEAITLIRTIDSTWKNNDGISWAISLSTDPLFIGNIAFWRLMKEHHRAEIGYLLQSDFHGKGIMHEAMRAVLAYGFDHMHLHSVEANVNPENNASINLLKKNDFVQEAYMRENYYYDGKFLDSAIYSLINKGDLKQQI